MFGKWLLNHNKEIQQKQHYKAYLKAKEEEMSSTVIYLDKENFNNMAKAFKSEHDNNYKFRIQTNGIDLVFFKQEKFENRMTREEARRLVFQKSNLEGTEACNLVDALEALGLLKFDEPELNLDEKISLKLNKALSTGQVTDVLNMLNHLGYTIVYVKD